MKKPVLAAVAVILCVLNAEKIFADSVNEFSLEKSGDMQNWEPVTVTQEMLTDDGGILVETDGPREFYRMQVRLLSLPKIENPLPLTTGIDDGESVTFTIDVDGPDVTYQWFFGESGDMTQPIEGATSKTFITGALFEDAAYWVRVTNSAGSRNSETARVSINRPPSIVIQPESTTIYEGDTATLSLEVTGSTPMSFQWYRGNVGVTTQPVGTNSSTFTTPALNSNTSYWVSVSNAFGITFSSQAIVSVVPPPPAINLFSADPDTILPGESSTLTWSVSGAASIEIDQEIGVVAASGSVEVSPENTTTYTLTATNAHGVSQLEVAIEVFEDLTAQGFALIPAGTFTMGDVNDGDPEGDAPPTNNVYVSAFYMAKYEVTKALWDEVRTWAISNGYTDLATGAGKASNHPVQTISWWDVVKWCNARSQKEGLTPVYTVSGAVMKTGTTAPTVNWSANGYRLPTEAEWEKAARGGVSGKRFPWGDTISHSQANYEASSDNSYDLSGAVNDYHPTYATGSCPYTSPVGAFAANGYGLYDMSGNVEEWCWDWYGASTYVNGATDPRGANSGSRRVLRDGSWGNYAYYCRVASRYYNYPSDSSSSGIGFRVARSSVP